MSSDYKNHAEIPLASASETLDRVTARSLGRLAAMNALKTNQQPEILIDDFSDVYDAKKIFADKRYVAGVEKHFDSETNELKTANVFEQMFISGVMLGNWLGGTTVEGDGIVEDFSPSARSTNRYDDLKNRIDTAVTLDFDEPIRDDENRNTMKKLVLGFDTTINNSRQQLLDKITRSSNTDVELPFGFSRLTYYQDDSGHGKIPLTPRYVVGLNGDEVNDVLQLSRIRQSDNTIDFELFSAKNLYNRFRILSEIRAENELYQAMLPDKLDSRVLKNASTQLYIADRCLNKALKVCAHELVKRKCLPTEINEKAASAIASGRSVKARNIIQEYLLRRDQEIFDSESKERQSQGKPTIGTGDTFVQIMQICDQLKDAAYSGKLNRFRQLGKRNFGLKMPRQTEAKLA